MERLADDAVAALAKTAEEADAVEADRQLSTVTEEIAAVVLTTVLTTAAEVEAGASCVMPPRKAAAAPLDPLDGSVTTRTTSG